MSERSKIVLRVEAEIKDKHCVAVDKRRANLAACLAKMEHEAEVEFIRTNALRLGLLGDSGDADCHRSAWTPLSAGDQ
jgi:hypothetical protein